MNILLDYNYFNILTVLACYFCNITLICWFVFCTNNDIFLMYNKMRLKYKLPIYLHTMSSSYGPLMEKLKLFIYTLKHSGDITLPCFTPLE